MIEWSSTESSRQACIWNRTLRSSSQVVLLRLLGGESTQSSGKVGNEFPVTRLDIQVEAINDVVTERSRSGETFGLGSEDIPQLLGKACGSIFRCKLVAWRVSPDGDQDLLAFLLADGHVALDVRAWTEDRSFMSILVRVVFGSPTSIPEVGARQAVCPILAWELIHEPNGNDINRVIVAKVSQWLLVRASTLHRSVCFFSISTFPYPVYYKLGFSACIRDISRSGFRRGKKRGRQQSGSNSKRTHVCMNERVERHKCLKDWTQAELAKKSTATAKRRTQVRKRKKQKNREIVYLPESHYVVSVRRCCGRADARAVSNLEQMGPEVAAGEAWKPDLASRRYLGLLLVVTVAKIESTLDRNPDAWLARSPG